MGRVSPDRQLSFRAIPPRRSEGSTWRRRRGVVGRGNRRSLAHCCARGGSRGRRANRPPCGSSGGSVTHLCRRPGSGEQQQSRAWRRRSGLGGFEAGCGGDRGVGGQDRRVGSGRVKASVRCKQAGQAADAVRRREWISPSRVSRTGHDTEIPSQSGVMQRLAPRRCRVRARGVLVQWLAVADAPPNADDELARLRSAALWCPQEALRRSQCAQRWVTTAARGGRHS
jgi:hypothetical protein